MGSVGEPNAKMPRLATFRAGMPYIAQAALAHILSEAQRNSLPKGSRAVIRKSRDALVQEVTPYGPLHTTMQLPRVSGGVPDLEIQDPVAFMTYMCLHSASYSDMVRRTHEINPSSPSSPWSVVIYNDEVTPGQQLTKVNTRKFQAVYWTVLEYGMEHICDEEAWGEMLFCRSALVSSIEGGMCAMFAKVIQHIWSRFGHDVQRGGVFLTLHSGETFRVFLQFGCIMADESALHMASAAWALRA